MSDKSPSAWVAWASIGAALVVCGALYQGGPQNRFIPIYEGGPVPYNKFESYGPEYSCGAFCEKAGYISHISAPGIKIFRPKKQANRIALLVLSGGGYTLISTKQGPPDVAAWFAERGYTAFMLKYRLPDTAIVTQPKRAITPVADAAQALRYIRSRAAEFGIDTSMIGVLGFSAGGHLAATLCNDTAIPGPHIDMPAFAVLVSPMITMGDSAYQPGRIALLGCERDLHAASRRFSQELHVTRATPPTLLFGGYKDEDVAVQNNAIPYYKALQAHGIPSALITYPDQNHNFWLTDSTRWMEAADGWIRQHIEH